MKYYLISILMLSNCLMASSLEDLEKQLQKGAIGEIPAKVSSELTEIILKRDEGDALNLNATEKIKAIALVGKYKISACVPALINKIESVTMFHDSIVSFDAQYPCVGAIVKIGDGAVPKLTEAIGHETDELRLRLMSYSLMNIMSKKSALEHLDKCIKDETFSNQTKSLISAKAEISKWHDK